MMRPEEHIRQAELICQRLRNAATPTGSGGRQRVVQGTDPNELKKLLAFLISRRDMDALKKLIDKLPTSNFAQRSGSTAGYYKNIQSVLRGGFYNLPVEDGIYVLAWVCRLL